MAGDEGGAEEVWFKPDFSPERLRSQPYALLLAVLPLDVVREEGGFRPEFGTAVWYDLVLRMASRLGAPSHLAGPFYLHRERGHGAPFILGDPFDRCRTVARVMAEAGESASVSPIEMAGRPVGQRVRRQLTRHPKVSLVIPTRASSSVIHGFPRCHAVEFIRSIWKPNRYPNLEIVVVYDTSTPAAALREIEEVSGGEVVLTPFYGPFHFSRKCNAGAVAATGEYVCFLNDDMEVVTSDWLHEMVGLLNDPEVGAVGARLLFADGTLQHAGHEYNGGYAGHTMFRYAADDASEGGAAMVTSERSGVTGACMLVRASDFLMVGGFSEEFPLSYNDVDLSLKIRAAGLRILYTPHATLLHYESQTRDPHVTDAEIRRIRWRWAVQLENDPYVNELRRTSFDGPAPVFD
ncbi:glycosyltransferase family 2 protein [Nakamurella sp. GG22]